MKRFWLTIGIVVIASIVSLWYGLSKYARFDLRDASDGDLADRYRLVCGARGDVRLDPARIPAELQALIPLAAKFGHGNRVLLEDCVAKMDKASSKRIADEIAEKRLAIIAWTSTFPDAFFADEVIAFRELLKLYELLRPVKIDPNKPVG